MSIHVFIGGDILFNGTRFFPKPRVSVTIAVWIKVETILQDQSVFDIVGNTFKHYSGRYHLEVKWGGHVRWFHINEQAVVVFNVITTPVIETGKWTHLAVTYDGGLTIARVG